MCAAASFWGCFGAGRAPPAAVPCLPGPAQPRSAQPSSPAGRLPQTWPFSQSCLESGGPSPGSSGMPRVSRFCLQSSWGGATEVIKLAGKVLKAEKHSCRLQTPSPAAKCRSRVMLCASSLMGCGAQRLPPKGTTLLPSQKHSCCLSVAFQFVLFLSNNLEVHGVVRARGASPCEGQWDAAQGHISSIQPRDGLCWRSSRGGCWRHRTMNSTSIAFNQTEQCSELFRLGEGAHSPAVLECSDWHLGE